MLVRTISLSDDCRQETAAANHTYNGGRRVFGISGSNPEHDVAVCLSLVPELWERVPLRPLKDLFAEQGWGACDQEGCGLVLLPWRSIFCPSAPRVGDVGIIRPHFGVAALLDVRQCDGGVIVVNASRNAVLLREGMIVAEEVVFERADSARQRISGPDLERDRRWSALWHKLARGLRQERDAARRALETAVAALLDSTDQFESGLRAVSDAKDALRQLKRERDEARRDRSDVQDRHWASLWHRAAKKHRGAAAIERYRADLLRQSLNAIEQERDEARRALSEAGEVLGAVCVASTLAPGESLKDPPRHAAVSAILSVIRERDIARSEAERLLRVDALLVEQERNEARRAGEREALEWALFELDGPGVQPEEADRQVGEVPSHGQGRQ